MADWRQGPTNVNALVDLDALRTRRRKMSDADLVKFGQAARYVCSPKANMGKPPGPEFVLQLNEARAEWVRRHPSPTPYLR